MIGRMTRPTVEELARRFELEPLPLEGGLFRQMWVGEPDNEGRPVGTAIIVLLAAEGGHFSAMHRLPIDETWYFQLGDPVELLLLDPGGKGRVAHLGPDVLGGHDLQLTVPAGTWMGARVADDGAWSLFATSMAPGFLPADYEGGEADSLAAAYPAHEALIRALCRA